MNRVARHEAIRLKLRAGENLEAQRTAHLLKQALQHGGDGVLAALWRCWRRRWGHAARKGARKGSTLRKEKRGEGWESELEKRARPAHTVDSPL